MLSDVFPDADDSETVVSNVFRKFLQKLRERVAPGAAFRNAGVLFDFLLQNRSVIGVEFPEDFFGGAVDVGGALLGVRRREAEGSSEGAHGAPLENFKRSGNADREPDRLPCSSGEP